MEKYLITGFSGFVSQHFIRYICNKNEQIEILGIDCREPDFDYYVIGKGANIRFLKKNLLNKFYKGKKLQEELFDSQKR